MVELMGKHSNIILVDQSTRKVLECIKHVDESDPNGRTRRALPTSASIRQGRSTGTGC
ncbi:MAG: NFACT family protein [Candidatus Poribacteria bacterium]|nr:NFACT family protein [Candidatus Poribacteria bacterium]